MSCGNCPGISPAKQRRAKHSAVVRKNQQKSQHIESDNKPDTENVTLAGTTTFGLLIKNPNQLIFVLT